MLAIQHCKSPASVMMLAQRTTDVNARRLVSTKYILSSFTIRSNSSLYPIEWRSCNSSRMYT